MNTLLRLANLRITETGDAFYNKLRYGFRTKVDFAEGRRRIRLKEVVKHLTDAGLGAYSKTDIERIIHKKLMQ